MKAKDFNVGEVVWDDAKRHKVTVVGFCDNDYEVRVRKNFPGSGEFDVRPDFIEYEQRINDLEKILTPKVGMPATICYITDREPATVSRVNASGKTLWVKRDKYEIVSGNAFDGSAQYKYEEDPANPEECFTYRKGRNRWARKGESSKGTGLALGNRRKYHDPSF